MIFSVLLTSTSPVPRTSSKTEKIPEVRVYWMNMKVMAGPPTTLWIIPLTWPFLASLLPPCASTMAVPAMKAPLVHGIGCSLSVLTSPHDLDIVFVHFHPWCPCCRIWKSTQVIITELWTSKGKSGVWSSWWSPSHCLLAVWSSLKDGKLPNHLVRDFLGKPFESQLSPHRHVALSQTRKGRSLACSHADS